MRLKEFTKKAFQPEMQVFRLLHDYKNFPAATKLLMNCIQDIRVTEFRLKWHFKRTRPYHLEPKLRPLARIHSPSFASGHSLWSFTEAYLFSEIIPEKHDELLQELRKCVGQGN